MSVEPSALLSRPPEEGARRLALSFLDQAAAAHPRLEDPSDTEALHDFRVALRRLRSCLKAYRKPLAGSVPKKLARRLRKLAQATGPGRDTEVQIEWLRSQGKHLNPAHRPGLAWQLQRLEDRMRDAYKDLTAEVADEFPDLERDLRRHLSVYQTEVHLDAGGPHPTLGDVSAAILRDQISDLEDHLAEVKDAGDEGEAHRARISAKRLRYLLEPLAGELEESEGAAPLVKRLKGLQDLLGELHDAHVLETELAEAVETAAAERARRLFALALQEIPDEALLRAERRRTREPGLLALVRRNRDRRDKLFAQIQAGWLDGRAEELLHQVEALARVMEQRADDEDQSRGARGE